MNFQSQPLQQHELEALKSDPAAIRRLIGSYRLMLNFYGMNLVNEDTGLLDRCIPPRNWKPRYQNLMRKSYISLS